MHAAPDQRPWLLDGSGFDAMASPSSLRTGPRVGWVVRHTSSTSPDRQRPSLSRRAPQPGAAPWLHDGSGAGGSRQLQGLASRHAMGREGSMSARMQPDAAHPGASAAAAERRRTALSHAAQRRGREEAHRTLVAAGTRQHQAPPPAVLPQPQQQLQQAMQPLPPPLPQPSSQPAPHSQQQGQQGSQQQLAAYVAGASESLEPSGPAVHEAVPPVQASAGTQDRPTVMASQQDGACAAAPPQSQQPVSGPASALHAAPAAAQQGAVLHGTGQQVPGQQGVSMTTAVVWELVTLMGMRTILSQAVSAMSEQMGGIVRQALHQQLGGLALNAMPAALASQQAAGAPAAQAAAACATHAAARAGAVAAAAPHAAASAFEGAWQLLPQALPHTGTTHHAGQAAGVSYSTAQAGLTFEEPQLLSYKEGSGLRRSPGSSSGSSDDASADGNAAAGGGGMLGANFAAQMQHVAAAWDDMAVRMVGQLQEGSLSSEGSAPAASFPEAGNGRAALGSTAQRLGGGSHAPASRPVPASMPAAPSLHSFRSGSLSSVYSDSFEAEGSTAVGAQAGASDIAPTAVAAAAGPHALRQQPRGVLSPKRQRSLQRHISELADIPEGGGRALETGSDEGGSELAGGLSSVASSGASSEHADLAAGRGAVTPLGAPHQQWQQQQQQPQLSRVSTLSLSLDSDLGRQLAGDMEPWTGAARSSSGSCNSCNSGSQHGSDAGQHEAVPAPLRLRKVAAAPAGSAAAPVARQHVSQQPRPRRAALQSAGGASLGRSVSQYSDVSFLSSYAASQEGDSPRESLRGAAADPPPWSAGANTGRATASAAASGGDSSWAAIAAAAHAPATSDDASSVGSGSIPERVSAAAAGSGWVEAARPQRLISAGRALQVLQLGSPEGSEEEQAEPASQPSQSAHSWQGSGALAPAGRPKTAAGRASWGSSPMAAATQAKGAAGSSKGSEGYEGGWGGSIKAGNWQQVSKGGTGDPEFACPLAMLCALACCRCLLTGQLLSFVGA